MRKLIIALAVTTAFTAPASARDGSPYVGVEGGLLVVTDTNFGYSDDDITVKDAYRVGHKLGLDVGGIAGYDFGMFRVEGEVAYKRATVNEVFVDDLIDGDGGVKPGDFDGSGRSTVLSVMGNALLDVEIGDRFAGYVGGGLGAARVNQRVVVESIDRTFNGRDSGMAYQAIAGLRYALTPNLDLGAKYRFFTVPKLRYDVDGPTPFRIDANQFRSHSILASLIYNFGAVAVAPPPPVIVEQAPPPAPAPATQTCPDGSVILATDMCPPPPPPPPAPAPERG